MICIRVMRSCTRVSPCMDRAEIERKTRRARRVFRLLLKKGLWLSRVEARRRRSGVFLNFFFYWKLKNRCPSTARKPLPIRMISSNCFSGLGRLYVFICFFYFSLSHDPFFPFCSSLALSGSHTSRRISRSVS